MIVRNEELCLQACLDSARDLVSEIVVVDTGSTDATRQIALRNGATVLPFDFRHVDFAAARNYAVAEATGEWILALDADETLHCESLPLIETLLARNDNAGYYVERHNHAAGKPEPAIDHAVRLFPNRPGYIYRGRVHETIDASILAGGGCLRTSNIRIDHRFSPDPESRRRRNRWYIDILMEELAADPTDHSRLDFLAAEFHQLGLFSEASFVAEWIARVRPLDPRAHLNAGIYHLMFCPDFAQARADFNRALELKPGYPEALSFLQTLDERMTRSQFAAVGQPGDGEEHLIPAFRR
jgi:glycosyltransferase involved in cell wall biosynthesis